MSGKTTCKSNQQNVFSSGQSRSHLSSPFYSDVGAQEPIKLTSTVESPRSEIVRRTKAADGGKEGVVKNSSAHKEKKKRKLFEEDQSINPEASRLSSS